jgi:hypothetical protein
MALPKWYRDAMKLIGARGRPSKPVDDHGPARTDTGSREPERPLVSRRIHIGIDYGTSWSKLAFRDYGLDSHRSFVVTPTDGAAHEFRFPSVACIEGGLLWFAQEAEKRCGNKAAKVYRSLKMRLAYPRQFYGAETSLPDELSNEDLVTLNIVYLLQRARFSIDRYLSKPKGTPQLTFTLGVPASDLEKDRLKSLFLRIAVRSWSLFKDGAPDLRKGISLAAAKELMAAHPSDHPAVDSTNYREWIRTEAEAALLSPFNSPDIGRGLYGAVDVGAGTTSAVFFNIAQAFHNSAWVKNQLEFFGTSCSPPGADKIDKTLAASLGINDPSTVRGRENDLLSSPNGAAIRPVLDQMFDTYRQAFDRAYRKMQSQREWEGYGLFLLGGGTIINVVGERLQNPAWVNLHKRLTVRKIRCPRDLELGAIAADDVRFLLVAYGLSFAWTDVPPCFLPSSVPDWKPRRGGREIDMDGEPDPFRKSRW